MAPDFRAVRRKLAGRYLRGDGLELGALHEPLEAPPGARVRYVDRLPAEELRHHYPELAERALVPVDVVDDGERLASIPDASVDFVIANHFLEHCEDPIAAIGTFLRVARPGGVVYLAVPDKRHSFDARRTITPLDHLAADHDRGPEASRRDHYLDWARHVLDRSGGEAEDEANRLMAARYSIHFHVWTRRSFLDFLRWCRDDRRMPFRIERTAANRVEVIAVLRKVGE
jgi:SAM-dependent methyltransferase